MTKKMLYLAGGLFNAGQRLFNLMLEKHLKSLGWSVVLPQREALNFFKDGLFDVGGIVEDCRQFCIREDVIVVANADGADADSGTCVEYGFAIATHGRAIVYRTDFRTALERELGINAMLNAKGTEFIYNPSFFTELGQVDKYFAELARNIDEAARKMCATQKTATG